MSLSRAARLALKLAKRKKYYKKELSSLHTKLRARGEKTEAKFKSKQKPKHPHGGPGEISQKGSYLGPRGQEAKLHPPMLGLSLIHI